MGRAQGQQARVAGYVRARRSTSEHDSPGAPEARRLFALIDGLKRYQDPRVELWQAAHHFDALRRSELPSAWAITLVLANAPTSMRDAEVVDRLLSDYLAARMEDALPGLKRARLVSDMDVSELTADLARAGAVVRAADLLAEREELLRVAATTDSEERRCAAEWLSQDCLHGARADLAQPDAHWAGFTLGASYGFRHADAQGLYDDGTVPRHRDLLAADAGVEVDAPIVLGSLHWAGKATGQMYAGRSGIAVGGQHRGVIIDPMVVQYELATESSSLSLIHELAHTLQGEDAPLPDTEAERVLMHHICEGATEKHAQLLVGCAADPNRYAAEAAFVSALATLVSERGGEAPRRVIRNIALTDHAAQSRVAASMLYGKALADSEATEAVRRLAAIAADYDRDASVEYYEPRHSPDELFAVAKARLQAL